MSIEKGCEVAVESGMGVKPNDKAVIVADQDSESR